MAEKTGKKTGKKSEQRVLEGGRARREREKRTREKRAVRILLIVVLIVGVLSMGYHILSLKAQQRYYAAREAELAYQIELEQQRTEELNEQEKFQLTMQYIIQIARERLGLVFPDEVIVEPTRGQ